MGKSHLFFYVRHEDILFNLDMRILGLPYVGRQSHLGERMALVANFFILKWIFFF